MKKIMGRFVGWVIMTILRLRYRVTIKGLKGINKKMLTKPGGIIFLPNHPSILDPVMVNASLKKFMAHPVIVEYMYYKPGVNWLARLSDGVPIPAFDEAHNTIKMHRSEKVFAKVCDVLRSGKNLLFYPAGRTTSTGMEVIGGSAGCHRILSEVPEANVVLVRTSGLWGSSSSRALTGELPPIAKWIMQSAKIVFKNLIFFTPKREVTIEFEVVNDLPYDKSRLEFNRALEEWYNKPYSTEDGKHHGEPLKFVSFSAWREEFPRIKQQEVVEEEEFAIEDIPEKIQKEVIAELAELADRKPEDITPTTDLATDLGLDSLDASTILLFLEDKYHVLGVQPNAITTVLSVMAFAAKKKKVKKKSAIASVIPNFEAWNKEEKKRKHPEIAEGETLPEVFFNTCARMGKKSIACADDGSGVLTYGDFKIRVALLADYIKTLPGDCIGILLPASIGANLFVLATLLAGKTPVMINWTVGSRHLETIVKTTGMKKVLTSWKFINRAKNVDFTGIEDIVVMLEDVKSYFTLGRKIKAALKAKKGTKALLKNFGFDKAKGDDTAVLLFTSGTEGMPKGVPLTHNNILSDLRAALPSIGLAADDILYAVLPPFHSFGFTVTGMMPLISGLKVAFFPDPTDSFAMANGIQRWKATVVCSAPTFLKGLLHSGTPEQLATLRYIITGAEKAPQELFDRVAELGEDKEVIEGYGITECAPVLTLNAPGTKKKGVGKALSCVQLLIVHPDTHEPLPIGERGLVPAKGDNVFHGYLQGTSTRSPFIETQGFSWYDTGDLGFLDEEGYLTLSGRMKRFVKIGGEMVSLQALEEGILEQGLAKGWAHIHEGPSTVVSAQEKDDDKTKFFLFTIFDIDAKTANDALKDAGFSNLARISDVIVVEDIPIAGTGKVNYRQLDTMLR
ncbi:MAG: AMP-binding protein [Waddliaceae bacterium]|nr:AMP-binding protein [Waddliaceae bacterium]